MRLHILLRGAALIAALSACGAQHDASPLDGLPDADGLTLEVQGGAAEGLAATASGAVFTNAALVETPKVNDDLAAGREKIAAVNTIVRGVFEHVAEVVKANGAPAAGDATVYGPVARCVVETACDAGGTATLRLRVAHPAERTWAFALQAQVGTEWTPVAAGWLRRGEVARRGVGRIAIDLDHLRAAAPAFPGGGQLLGGFANGRVAKRVAYRLVAFTPDPARWPATTAAFRGFKTDAGVTRVRVAGIDDLYGPAGSDTELGFAHVAWAPAVGGRAFAVVTDYVAGGVAHGDVPPSDAGAAQYFFGRACYAPGTTTPAFKEWFLCARGTAPRDCVTAQGGAGEVVVGTGSWQTACATASEPAELGLPAQAPAAGATDDAAEAGEDGTALEAPTPPSDMGDLTPTA